MLIFVGLKCEAYTSKQPKSITPNGLLGSWQVKSIKSKSFA